MPDAALHVLDHLPGVTFVPIPVERFGRYAKLHYEVVRKVLGLNLAAFFLPEVCQGGFVAPHYDPGIGAADEAPATKTFGRVPCGIAREGHDALQFSCSRISSAALRITPTASADKSWNRLSR